MAQVVGGRQLARRMALEGQGGLGRRDAAAVVLDADQPPAALAHLDADVGRARVQAVFDQLLDRGRRPLDHLAGGDLVGNFGSEDVDGHERIVPQAGCTQNWVGNVVGVDVWGLILTRPRLHILRSERRS